MANGPITLHMLGLPHTITRPDFPSQCAFNGKVLRFSPMMRHAGNQYKVIHYGVETSESGADEEVVVLTRDRWEVLRVQSYVAMHPNMSVEAAKQKLADNATFVGTLANICNVLYSEFNANLRKLLEERVGQTPGAHVVCLPFGKAHEPAIAGKPYLCIETGIGYVDSFLHYRIFESSEWMHATIGRAFGFNYWFVCPNYYCEEDWPLCLNPRDAKIVRFLGRLDDCKGLQTVLACAQRMPETTFEICGPGDPVRYLRPNVVYRQPLQGNERADYLGNCAAVLALSHFVEPFNGVSAESNLCGTPVICTAFGALLTNVEHGRTGFHTHTLQDIVEAIKLCQTEGYFDRSYIRKRAVKLWGYASVAKKYDHAFKCLIDVHYGQGWYSQGSHLALTLESEPKQKEEPNGISEASPEAAATGESGENRALQ